MKIVTYFKKWMLEDRVFKNVWDLEKDTEIGYTYADGKWYERSRPVDNHSGMGDSDLYDVITEKMALEYLGIDKWPEGTEPGEDEVDYTEINPKALG